MEMITTGPISTTGMSDRIILDEDQAAAHFGDDTLNWLLAAASPYTWSVFTTGSYTVHTHLDPGQDGEDAAEFTQRTALKFAADAIAAGHDKSTEEPLYAVVLHHGHPWTLREWDGPADAYCEWFDYEECDYFCNQCFEQIPGQRGCPEHAPTSVPGLQVAECSEPDKHPRTFIFADNGGYGAPCGWCAYDAMSEAHKDCEHAHHWAWRRWRVTRKVFGALYQFQISTGWCYSTCKTGRTCISRISWRWSS